MSYATAALTLLAAFAVGATSAPAARVAAATSAAMRIDFFNFPPRSLRYMYITCSQGGLSLVVSLVFLRQETQKLIKN